MKRLLSFVLLALMATSAQAATVTFSLLIDEDGPGTFNLYASTGGDNSGIASYGVPLLGGITGVDHNSPNALAQDAQDVGFRLLRTPDGNTFVSGSQNTVLPTSHIVKGFGQTGGDLVNAPGVTALIFPEQPVYDAFLLLASGTWLGNMPSFNPLSVDLGANVFTSPTTNANIIADIATVTTVVPEPGTIVLGSFGALTLLGLAYRRNRRRS